jgi:hypothetical protein
MSYLFSGYVLHIDGLTDGQADRETEPFNMASAEIGTRLKRRDLYVCDPNPSPHTHALA